MTNPAAPYLGYPSVMSAMKAYSKDARDPEARNTICKHMQMKIDEETSAYDALSEADKLSGKYLNPHEHYDGYTLKDVLYDVRSTIEEFYAEKKIDDDIAYLKNLSTFV